MTAEQHTSAPLVLVRSADLDDSTAQTPGMNRRAAIHAATGSQGLWLGETVVSPGAASGDHHHGHSETGIYVVSGRPVFVQLDGDREIRLQAEPGDYVYVPPFTPHREENPDPSTPAVVVIARTTQEAIVVNLPAE